MCSIDNRGESLKRRLADGLGRLAIVSRQLNWQAAEVEGLSPTQAEILRYVSRHPAGERLTAVAANAGVRSATASDAVAALVRKGLVGKHADLDDGRAVVLKATRRGHALVARWPANFEPAVSGLDGAEQEVLLRLVLKMIKDLQQRSLIAPQRTCVTCRFYRENRQPGAAEPHYCALIGANMADRDLRVDCLEHEATAA